MAVTGLVLSPFETFQHGFVVDEPSVSLTRTYESWDSIPAAYRVAWWSTDPGVVSVDSIGILRGVAAGEAVIWVQVESERDSAVVRVTSAQAATAPRYASIQAASSHTCARTDAGKTHCWGSDRYGALGRGAVRWFTDGAAPERVVGGNSFLQLALRGSHTCGLVATGDAWCWGQNRTGQHGLGSFDSEADGVAYVAGESQPLQVVGGIQFVQLAAADVTTCGVTGDGNAYCWGSNISGQLGIGSPDPTDHRAVPTAVAGSLTFRLLAAGEYHVCGVTTDDQTYCWGDHNEAVPSGPGRASNEPYLVSGAPEFDTLVAGNGFTCGLTASSDTYCWGGNGSGQLGHDSTQGSQDPTLLAAAPDFATLTAGSRHTCGLTSTGEAFCWGENDNGQLGNGQQDSSFGDVNPDPQPVVGTHSFTAISAARDHTCGLTVDGDAYCWGWMNSGQLGNGKVQPLVGAPGRLVSAVPVRVVAPME
jgi:alpha-tubulin suppressor-like RCC1 family protein